MKYNKPSNKKPKIRKLGDVLLDMEPLIDELVDHGLQMGDILALIRSHLLIHNPECIEEYVDGTAPEYFYGPSDSK